jgi:hypothetical protein
MANPENRPRRNGTLRTRKPRLGFQNFEIFLEVPFGRPRERRKRKEKEKKEAPERPSWNILDYPID